MAVDTRTVDRPLLLQVTAGTIACKIVSRFLQWGKESVTQPLNARLHKHYTLHAFHARARLDVPTFDDPAVQRQLDSTTNINGMSVAWNTFQLVSELANASVRVISQVSVLATVLRNQPDGPMLAALSAIPALTDCFRWQVSFFTGAGGTCA